LLSDHLLVLVVGKISCLKNLFLNILLALLLSFLMIGKLLGLLELLEVI
jgi:hypothetical protein